MIKIDCSTCENVQTCKSNYSCTEYEKDTKETSITELCSICALASRCIVEKDEVLSCTDYLKIEPPPSPLTKDLLQTMRVLLEREIRINKEIDEGGDLSLYFQGVNRGIQTGLSAIEAIEEYLESKENA